jgi:hypothetical protein
MTVESTKLKPSQKNQIAKDNKNKDKQDNEQKGIVDQVKKSLKLTDSADDKLALMAGMSMMGDFQKSLFPVMVENVKDHIDDDEITVTDSQGTETKLKRHKILPREAMQLDKWIMGEDLPDPLPEPFDYTTWILFKKMQLYFTGFTEDHFWNTPIETMEFWDQLYGLKRQGFRRDLKVAK